MLTSQSLRFCFFWFCDVNVARECFYFLSKRWNSRHLFQVQISLLREINRVVRVWGEIVQGHAQISRPSFSRRGAVWLNRNKLFCWTSKKIGECRKIGRNLSFTMQNCQKRNTKFSSFQAPCKDLPWSPINSLSNRNLFLRIWSSSNPVPKWVTLIHPQNFAVFD